MGKPWLEGFKFFTYLAVPIALTATFAVNPENLESIIRNVRARDGKRARERRRASRRPRGPIARGGVERAPSSPLAIRARSTRVHAPTRKRRRISSVL